MISLIYDVTYMISYNHRNQNKVDIFGALIILRIQFEIQCEKGTRDVNTIWVTVVTSYILPYSYTDLYTNIVNQS